VDVDDVESPNVPPEVANQTRCKECAEADSGENVESRESANA
jgi:hypothetical protein